MIPLSNSSLSSEESVDEQNQWVKRHNHNPKKYEDYQKIIKEDENYIKEHLEFLKLKKSKVMYM